MKKKPKWKTVNAELRKKREIRKRNLLEKRAVQNDMYSLIKSTTHNTVQINASCCLPYDSIAVLPTDKQVEMAIDKISRKIMDEVTPFILIKRYDSYLGSEFKGVIRIVDMRRENES